MSKLLSKSLLGLLIAILIGCGGSPPPTTEPTPVPSDAAKQDLMKQYTTKGKATPPASQKGL